MKAIPFVLSLILFATCGTAWALPCDYYASPEGRGNGRHERSPFRIIDFWRVATPGKTLCLLDGTYRGAANMIAPGKMAPGKSGAADAPISIVALHDGAVDIDGQFIDIPVRFSDNHYWTVEGINAHSSAMSVLYINAGSTHITVRRSVFWDAPINANIHILGIHGSRTSNILLEDVAAFGAGRKVFQPSQGPTRVTCRRCYLRWGGSTFSGPGNGTFGYASTFITLENVLATWNNETIPQSYISPYDNAARDNFRTLSHQSFFTNGIAGTAGVAINAKILGSIIYVPASLVHPFTTESFQAMLFLHNRVDVVTVKDSIVAFHPSNSAFTVIRPLLSTGAKNASTVAFENVTTLGGLPNLTGRDQTNENLVASTSRSLTGGIPSVFTGHSNPWLGSTGAQICKRYENGALTDTPLWPWPMNDRIKAATAAAGAYRGPCSFDCVGGRPVRPAIDVTEEIEAFFGAIPPQCKSE